MAEDGGEYRADATASTQRFHESLIRAAKEGDQDKAWLLIQLLVDELDQIEGNRPLLKYAADFFDHLFLIHKEKRPGPLSRQDAVAALGALNLFAGSGRPANERTIILAALASEELLRRDGRDPAFAQQEVAGRYGRGAFWLRDLRTKHPELVRLVEVATKGELEGLKEKPDK